MRDANFFAGLATFDTGEEPYRAPKLLYYRPYYEDVAEPHLVVDVSGQFEIKIKALEAYASQFYNPAYEAPPTPVSSEAFWNAIRARAAYWGSRVGVAYGEPLYADGPLGLDLPPGLEDTA